MGERSTAGSICDSKPVEVNNKVHKKRGRRKFHRESSWQTPEWRGDWISLPNSLCCLLTLFLLSI